VHSDAALGGNPLFERLVDSGVLDALTRAMPELDQERRRLQASA
jgi:hypothetical protein